MIHIINIHIKLFFPCHTVSSMYLCITGKSRSYLMSPALMFIIEWQIRNKERPGPANCKLALSYTEQFRQFIQTGTSQLFAKISKAFFIRQ